MIAWTRRQVSENISPDGCEEIKLHVAALGLVVIVFRVSVCCEVLKYPSDTP